MQKPEQKIYGVDTPIIYIQFIKVKNQILKTVLLKLLLAHIKYNKCAPK